MSHMPLLFRTTGVALEILSLPFLGLSNRSISYILETIVSVISRDLGNRLRKSRVYYLSSRTSDAVA